MTSRARFCGPVVFCALAIAIAQQEGSIEGFVTDASGAAIRGAEVQLSDRNRGFERKAIADARGAYRFVSVPVGTYQLSVNSPGFQKYVQTIRIGGAETANVRLDVGAIAERTEINASMTSARQRASRIPARGIRKRSAKFDTEQYDHFEENDFAEARRSPLSTFGADVDTASYSNVRRFLRQGRLPPVGSVRVEELINYFTYDYPEPSEKMPFSVTTCVSTCPWKPEHKLLHIGLRTPSVNVSGLPPSNLVFLIDVSGSMNAPEKLPLVQKSLQLLVEQSRPKDRVAIVVYAGAAGMVLAPTAGNEKERIVSAIEALRAGGSTHGSEGIRLAYQLARESFVQGGNNRVILATDGDFNVGVSSDAELIRLIETERDSGVFLTVLGFGMGNYKDAKMEKLADHGNGVYAYVDTLREARKLLVEQMAGSLLTVAKDVKLQVEFNPARVKAYRLIGYENRILRPEEFNDDKKNAGDLGAGMAVTALYEIVSEASSEAVARIDDLRYQERPPLSAASRSSELAMLKFRYKRPTEKSSQVFTEAVRDSSITFLQAPAETRFAAAVAEYGLVLRRSRFAGSASLDHARSVAQDCRGLDRGGHRAEFVELIETAARMFQGGFN